MSRILNKCISIFLILIIVVCVINLGKIFLKYHKARSEYKKISEIALVDPNQFTGEINWKKLKKINPEIVAWIYLEGTPINYPVTKCANNEKYLHRSIDGTYNFAGTPFIDCRAEDNFNGFNTVIYGHHMKDGSMFNSLSKYLRDDKFYKSHKRIELITPDEKYHLEVFTGFTTKAESYVYTQDISADLDKYDHIKKIKESNKITNMEDLLITPLDRIVTLSTCAYDFKDARYVIIGKLNPWAAEEKAEAVKVQKEIDKSDNK